MSPATLGALRQTSVVHISDDRFMLPPPAVLLVADFGVFGVNLVDEADAIEMADVGAVLAPDNSDLWVGHEGLLRIAAGAAHGGVRGRL